MLACLLGEESFASMRGPMKEARHALSDAGLLLLSMKMAKTWKCRNSWLKQVIGNFVQRFKH